MNKIEELNKILDKYKQGTKYCECLYLISKLEEDSLNYELLCQTFDEAIQEYEREKNQ